MRRRTIASGILGLVVSLSAVLAMTGIAEAAPAIAVGTSVTPTADIVGIGLVNCAVVTGEVGFSPATIAGGTATETVSIWLEGTKCTPVPGTATKPVPTSVIASMSFTSVRDNACPQLGALGAGTLNLAYEFPPAPAVMIDPSVAPKVTVKEVGPLWNLAGPVTAGSYPSPGFKASLKPIVVGGQTCGNGITSMYITSGTLTAV